MATILTLPVELKLVILDRIRDSLNLQQFELDPVNSMYKEDEWYRILLLLSLFHREWTRVAQSMLLHHLILRSERKASQFLRKVDDEGMESVVSVRLGNGAFTEAEIIACVKKIGVKCPRVTSVFCCGLAVGLHYFGECSPARSSRSVLRTDYTVVDRRY